MLQTLVSNDPELEIENLRALLRVLPPTRTVYLYDHRFFAFVHGALAIRFAALEQLVFSLPVLFMRHPPTYYEIDKSLPDQVWEGAVARQCRRKFVPPSGRGARDKVPPALFFMRPLHRYFAARAGGATVELTCRPPTTMDPELVVDDELESVLGKMSALGVTLLQTRDARVPEILRSPFCS